MKIVFKLTLLACSAFALLPWVSPARAQAPSGAQPLHIIVPFAPGGAQDVIGRYIGDKLSARLGVPVVVENKSGAGGVIAAETVAKATPNGKTLLLASGGAISIVPHLNPKISYAPLTDFTPVALVADTPMTLSVATNSPYASVADVLKDAKARPGQVQYASTGHGTVSHLTGELFAQTMGIQLVHVPYRGAAPALTDLIGGQIPLIVTSAASIDPMVESGKARVLATFTTARIPAFRGAPTIAEATGAKGLEVPVWSGLLAPAKTPAAVVDQLSNEVMAICKLPETQERFKGLGAVASCGNAKEMEKVVREDYERWGKVIRQGNIKAE